MMSPLSSLSDLKTDGLYHILEYLTRKDLQSLGFSSHFFKNFVLNNPQTEFLFLPHGRRYWKNLYHLKKVLVGNYLSCGVKVLNRLGILSRGQEDASLAFDHSIVNNNISTHPCAGYFGFCLLPKEVAVWGDFSGVSFLPDADAFVSQSGRPNGILFGDSFQVMAVCQEGSFLFWGCASGDIHCISVETNNNTDSIIQEYPYISGNSQHPNEITSLTKVGNGHLASGSVIHSQVLVHWNALQDGHLERTSRIDYALESTLSLASCEVNNQIYLSVGGSDQTLFHSCWPADALIPYTITTPTLSPPSVPGHVVYLSYLGSPSPRLVIGSSVGDLVVATLCYPDMTLEEEYSLVGCCPGGCVESVELVGTILITAGGVDGRVQFWEFESGASLGTLRVHPGHRPPNCQQILYSAVVATYFCHERASLMSLCRDGHVREWSLEEELEKAEAKQRKKKKKKRPRVMSHNESGKCRRTNRLRSSSMPT
jgi:hypothetical protein